MAASRKEANWDFRELLQTRIQEHRGMELNLWGDFVTMSAVDNGSRGQIELVTKGLIRKVCRLEPWEDGYLGASWDIFYTFPWLLSSRKLTTLSCSKWEVVGSLKRSWATWCASAASALWHSSLPSPTHYLSPSTRHHHLNPVHLSFWFSFFG